MRTTDVTGAVGCGLAFWLSGCSQVLDVLDDIDMSGEASSGTGAVSPPVASPPEGACGCTISGALRPLSCTGEEVPLLDNPVVQASRDGSVVVFNVCEPEFDCRLMYWDGGEAREIGTGLLIDISDSGRHALSSGGAGLEFFDVDVGVRVLPIASLDGADSVSASGDAVFGAQYLEGRTQLVRLNVRSGAIEVLGAVEGQIVRAYATPDAANVVGSAFELEGDYNDFGFRWREGAGLTLGLPGVADDVIAWPESLSDDGRSIAGRARQPAMHFYFSEEDGYVELAPASWRSETFISADGAVVLGTLDAGARDSSAFRWTRETGVVDLTPDGSSLAVAMSDDGDVIAAHSWDDAMLEGAGDPVDPEETYIWDSEHGTRTLSELLESRGVDATGWEFGHPRALSADGHVLLGRAHCGGTPTLYRLVLTD
ncbi:MAG TPA: hypothetical protein VNN80_31710 [Polyangiaceae bacterium]|nr:hypothetical protein [Polyangiaceae bacterium]